jgi:hypothetical protein
VLVAVDLRELDGRVEHVAITDDDAALAEVGVERPALRACVRERHDRRPGQVDRRDATAQRRGSCVAGPQRVVVERAGDRRPVALGSAAALEQPEQALGPRADGPQHRVVGDAAPLNGRVVAQVEEHLGQRRGERALARAVDARERYDGAAVAGGNEHADAGDRRSSPAGAVAPRSFRRCKRPQSPGRRPGDVCAPQDAKGTPHAP